MKNIATILGLGIILAASSINSASAVCCFPWDITFHIDPETGFLVVNGELWNDSYNGEPFGKTDYRFRFSDENFEGLFERDIEITDKHPIVGGFVIPPGAVFPFQIVIDDVEPEIINKVAYVSTDGTNNLEYFNWKPADLRLKLQEIDSIQKIHQNGQNFTEWQITGTITNTNSDKTENVYVLASLYGKEEGLVGVAGYSDLDIQPLTLDGLETKQFTLFANIPSEMVPADVSLYAESDDSSMIYKFYMPLILRDATDPTKRISTEYKKPFPIIANITNTSRESIDFDWIIQIKKSPKGPSEGDVTNYPESDIVEIHSIPSHVSAQDKVQLKYFWTPPTDGIYFYEEFVWQNSQPKSFPFKGTFLSDNWIMADYTSHTLKNQIKSGIPFDKLECKENLFLILKYDGTHACVKPESIEKLIDRNWTTMKIIEERTLKNMSENLISKIEISLDEAKVIPNFPKNDAFDFEKISQEMNSTCFSTPSGNLFCYKKPMVHQGQDIDHLSSIIVGDNEINGEIHFDKVGLDGGIFTIKKMSLIDNNTALITFGDKDYRIGNKDRTTYEILEKFEFDSIVKKFDSFITHCGNFEGSAATIVQYLGTTTIDGIEYFVTWHTVITSNDGFECKYPEIIQQSLKHDFKEL